MAIFADSTSKTQNKSYWAKVKRFAATKTLTIGAVVALISALAFGVWGADKAKLESEFNEILVCTPEDFGEKVDGIFPNLDKLSDYILLSSRHVNPNIRFHANCIRVALNPKDQAAIKSIADELSLVDLNECLTLVATSKRQWAQLAPAWREEAERLLEKATELMDSDEEKNHEEIASTLRSCSRLAIHLAFLGDTEPLANLMSATKNPLPRSIAILELADWHLGFDELVLKLDRHAFDQRNGDLINGIASGIGLSNSQEMPSEKKRNLVEWLTEFYKTNHHGGAHFAARFALKKLQAEVPKLDPSEDADRQWKHIVFEVPNGDKIELPFVKVHKGEFVSGAGSDIDRSSLKIGDDFPLTGELVKVDKDFWISVTGIQNGAFHRLLAPEKERFKFISDNLNHMLKQKDQDGWAEKISVNCSFQSSLALSNQVSKYCGVSEYYEGIEKIESVKRKEKGGFRLPLERELELATRGGSATKYYAGNNLEIAKALLGKNGNIKIDQFPPNANGLSGCSLYRERVDKTQILEGELWAFFKGGFSSPNPSTEVSLLPGSSPDGVCRLVFDE